HAIEIRYYEGGGGQELNVNVSGPDTSSIKTALFDTAMVAPASATVDVSVAPANTSPHLLNLNDSAHTIEQTPVRLDDNAIVVDGDLDKLNSCHGLYPGASLTLVRQGGANAEDTYAFDTAGALFTVSGN